jgi:hypothetical protein
VTGPLCRSCGHRNQLGAKYCSSCGVALEPDPRTDTVALEAIEVVDDYAFDRSQIPDSQGLLIVTRGPNLGARYALDQPLVRIGRHPDSDIFLDDVTVSRRHAELLRDGDTYVLRDASSLNGTYCNRARIDEVPVQDGDEVQIGKFKLVFFHGTRQ